MITNSSKFLSNQGDGYITVSNLGGFVAMFNIGYSLNGKWINLQSNKLTVLLNQTITIPSNANTIILTVKMNALVAWVPIYGHFFSSPPRMCYILNGTVFNPTCSSVPCSSNGIGSNPIPPVVNFPNFCNCCCIKCR